MTVQVVSENQIVHEVAQLLLEHLPPAKVARFWASWQIGQGDYIAWREKAFSEETVDSLYDKIVEFQEAQSSGVS